MASSPRDASTVLTALEATTQALNPRLDTRKGPIAVIYWANAVDLSKTEQDTSYLRSLFQLERPELIDQEDLESVSRNFGNDPTVAKVSRGTVYFYRNSRPLAATQYRVDTGWTVSTSDGRFSFVTVESVVMNGDAADAYYNATTRRYEVPCKVEAVAAGQDYDLPPGTINTMVTTQQDFNGVVNRAYMKQGGEQADKYQIRNNIWDRLQGINRESAGVVATVLQDIDPTGYDSFSMVASTDYTSFVRHAALQDKMGYDVYLISDTVDETTQTGTAQGGEMSITLDNRPVFSVVYCLVDGVSTPFSLSLSTDQMVQGSSRGIDKIDLTAPLQPAQTYEIRYLYYSVIQQANQAVANRTRTFGTDVLFRSANPVQIYIAGHATTITTSEASTVAADIQTFTVAYLRNPENPTAAAVRQFVTTLDPEAYQRAVEQTVNGVSQFRLTHFARLDVAAQDIEYISLDGKTEYPILAIGSTFV